MKILFVFFTILPVLLNAQTETAVSVVKFVEGLNWEQVKAKAKSEGKFIFVDCYATWCGPCKRMDKDVFPLKEVAESINPNFISIKVQMDSSKNDNELITKWYKDAQFLKQNFKVTALPTFLFFSPNGNLVHRAMGYHNSKKLIEVCNNAQDPKKQYYHLIELFRDGTLDVSEIKYLAKVANLLGDKELAKEIAAIYINGLSESELYTKDNIQFMRQFSQRSKDRAFAFFYDNARKINSIMNDNSYAQRFVSYIIKREDVEPLLITISKLGDASPNWQEISGSISKKYGSDYAKQIIVEAKVNWFQLKKEWPEYTKNLIILIEKFNTIHGGGYNNCAWDVFKYSTNKKELRKALKWSEKALREEPKAADFMDTYANLLYKLGKVSKAIEWEKKAIKSDPNSTDYHNTLVKMERGDPTWPVK